MAALRTEMLDCDSPFSVPCWTREEATLYLQDESGRGHGCLRKQAVTISQGMDFHLTEPQGPATGLDSSATLQSNYCYSDYQISPAPRTSGSEFYLETAQTYFEDVMIIILRVSSSARLVFARRKAFVDRVDAGLQFQLSFAEPGRSDILATIPTNIQGLDSKGSGTQLSTRQARVGVMH